MNRKHLRRLVKAMYEIQDFPALDEYGSEIFGRPVKGTWKLFRHITKTAVADVWKWSPDKELASYPREIKVPVFDEFATFMLHETTHGWCYFLKDGSLSRNHVTVIDEEKVCWDVSKLVCEGLGILYQKKLANLSYEFHCCAQTDDMKGLLRVLTKLPAHLQS